MFKAVAHAREKAWLTEAVEYRKILESLKRQFNVTEYFAESGINLVVHSENTLVYARENKFAEVDEQVLIGHAINRQSLEISFELNQRSPLISVKEIANTVKCKIIKVETEEPLVKTTSMNFFAEEN